MTALHCLLSLSDMTVACIPCRMLSTSCHHSIHLIHQSANVKLPCAHAQCDQHQWSDRAWLTSYEDSALQSLQEVHAIMSDHCHARPESGPLTIVTGASQHQGRSAGMHLRCMHIADYQDNDLPLQPLQRFSMRLLQSGYWRRRSRRSCKHVLCWAAESTQCTRQPDVCKAASDLRVQ